MDTKFESASPRFVLKVFQVSARLNIFQQQQQEGLNGVVAFTVNG